MSTESGDVQDQHLDLDFQKVVESSNTPGAAQPVQLPSGNESTVEDRQACLVAEERLAANTARVAAAPSRQEWLQEQLRIANDALSASAFAADNLLGIDESASLKVQSEQIEAKLPFALVGYDTIVDAVATRSEPILDPVASERVADWLQDDLHSTKHGVVANAGAAILPRVRSKLSPELWVLAPLIATGAAFIGSQVYKAAFKVADGRISVTDAISHVRDVLTGTVGTVIEHIVSLGGPAVGGRIGAAIGALFGAAPLGMAVGTMVGKLAGPAIALARGMASKQSLMDKVVAGAKHLVEKLLPRPILVDPMPGTPELPLVTAVKAAGKRLLTLLA